MEITRIQGVIISSIFAISLSGCSNSSSWDRADDSPWKAKREASLAAVADEEFVEVNLEEVERIPVMEDPVIIEAAVSVPESVAKAVPEPAPVLDMMNAPASAFAVQVYAGSTLKSVNRYQRDHGLDNVQIVKTRRDGNIFYVLVSIQPDRVAADQKSKELEQSTGSKPWVRPIAGLQHIAVQ